jgi:CRISPR/Cas system-associated endonuclease Cas1
MKQRPGLDPRTGIMHGANLAKSAPRLPLALDLMEPLRPVVDRAVLISALDKTLNPRDFTIVRGDVGDIPDGAVRLKPEMARSVAKVAYEAIEAEFARRAKRVKGSINHTIPLISRVEQLVSNPQFAV